MIDGYDWLRSLREDSTDGALEDFMAAPDDSDTDTGIDGVTDVGGGIDEYDSDVDGWDEDGLSDDTDPDQLCPECGEPLTAGASGDVAEGYCTTVGCSGP